MYLTLNRRARLQKGESISRAFSQGRETSSKLDLSDHCLPYQNPFAVKRKRLSVEQIVAVLKQAEVGAPVVEVRQQVGITELTFYRWKKKFERVEIDQVGQLTKAAPGGERQ